MIVRLPTAKAGNISMRTENALCLMHINFLPAIFLIGNLNSKSQFNFQAAEGFHFRLSSALLHKYKCLRDQCKHHFISRMNNRSSYLFSSRAKLKNKGQWF